MVYSTEVIYSGSILAFESELSWDEKAQQVQTTEKKTCRKAA